MDGNSVSVTAMEKEMSIALDYRAEHTEFELRELGLEMVMAR